MYRVLKIIIRIADLVFLDDPSAFCVNFVLFVRVYKDYKLSGGHVMEELVPDTLAHLSESHLAYFNKWSTMLLIESSEEVKWKTVSNLWCKTIDERLVDYCTRQQMLSLLLIHLFKSNFCSACNLLL